VALKIAASAVFIKAIAVVLEVSGACIKKALSLSIANPLALMGSDINMVGNCFIYIVDV